MAAHVLPAPGGLVDVVAEKGDEVRVVGDDVPVGAEIALLVLLAGGEGKAQPLDACSRDGRGARAADGALRVESRLPLGSIEFNYRAFSSPRWSPDGVLLGLVVTNRGTSWVEVFEANTGRLFYTSPPEHDTFTWTAARQLKLGTLEIHLSKR